jgi:hypothetical protein
MKFLFGSSAKVIQALIRDGFRCVVTRIYDLRFASVPYITMTDKELLAAGGVVRTECAHIVPDSTYFNLTASSPDKVWPFSGFLDLIPHLGLFCLCVGSLEAVRVHCRRLEWRESAFFVQCDDNAEGCSRLL